MKRPASPLLRVAILGAESTGKSTLASALAERYGTGWVPEYLRHFVETRQRTPLEDEQITIARAQIEHEELAAATASRVLFCDTTPLMTAIYSRFYWGRVDPGLDALAKSRRYDLTVVTAPDCPWTADGLQRESEEVRRIVHEDLVRTLRTLDIGFLLAAGSLEQRVRHVSASLDSLIAAGSPANMRTPPR
jgi:NadR type nicotinamide-nucleotide adenylyltransferase